MSCNITVSVSDDFSKEAKRLAKKYPSFKQDYKEILESIKNNPLQGDEIAKNIRKIRMAIKAKGKGKSGGQVLLPIIASFILFSCFAKIYSFANLFAIIQESNILHYCTRSSPMILNIGWMYINFSVYIP